MRVAVLGAGYAGLTVARRLERSLPEAVEIVVVDESTDHLLLHELHRVIRHPELADTITVDLDAILSRAEVRQATVTDVDVEEGVATLDGTEELAYDYAAVCLGSRTEFYGLEGVEEHASPLKRLEDARSIRQSVLDAAGGSVVVGGGGLSGIQTAGELAELSADEGLDLDITLVEMAAQIAPGFDATFAEAVRRELDARGVDVETGVAVESADEGTVHLEDGRDLPAEVFVWTGGIRGPDALDGKRPPTPRDLRVSDSTFVVGDAASLTDAEGVAVPASAQTAVRQARVAAGNIARLVDGDETGPVTIPVSGEAASVDPGDWEVPGPGGEDAESSLSAYDHEVAGWVVSVGDGAVAKVGPVVFSGEPAKAAKTAVAFGHLGSVGAIRQASELVAESLGWPTSDRAGLADRFEGKPVDKLPTDPASPSEFGDPLAAVVNGFDDVLASPETLDLTALTRPADPHYPGSPMQAFRRTVSDSLGTLFESTDHRTGETTEIEVTSEGGEPDELDVSDGDNSEDEDGDS